MCVLCDPHFSSSFTAYTSPSYIFLRLPIAVCLRFELFAVFTWLHFTLCTVWSQSIYNFTINWKWNGNKQITKGSKVNLAVTIFFHHFSNENYDKLWTNEIDWSYYNWTELSRARAPIKCIHTIIMITSPKDIIYSTLLAAKYKLRQIQIHFFFFVLFCFSRFLSIFNSRGRWRGEELLSPVHRITHKIYKLLLFRSFR